MTTDLLETLRALAPVVTPGEWTICQKQIEANAALIVTLRNALPTIIAALEAAALVRDEGWLEDRISDSLDVDWRPIDAARAIVAALPKEEV